MATMQIRATLSAIDLDQEDIQGLTVELCRELNRETNVEAKLLELPPSAGGKGDPLSIGAMTLTFMTSGAAVALMKLIESCLSRRSSLEVELERPDGQKMIVRGKDIRPEEVQRTADLARKFFENQRE
jgi:hypothetical protein